MVANLSAEDMSSLAAYFQAQKPTQRAARDAALVKLGQEIYRGGILSKSVAACTACHAAEAHPFIKIGVPTVRRNPVVNN